MSQVTESNVTSIGGQFVEVHGYALRVVRERSRRSVADLAKGLGIDRSYITHLENGTKRRVSRDFYIRLLNELQIEDHRALLAEAPVRDIPA